MTTTTRIIMQEGNNHLMINQLIKDTINIMVTIMVNNILNPQIKLKLNLKHKDKHKHKHKDRNKIKLLHKKLKVKHSLPLMLREDLLNNLQQEIIRNNTKTTIISTTSTMELILLRINKPITSNIMELIIRLNQIAVHILNKYRDKIKKNKRSKEISNLINSHPLSDELNNALKVKCLISLTKFK